MFEGRERERDRERDGNKKNKIANQSTEKENNLQRGRKKKRRNEKIVHTQMKVNKTKPKIAHKMCTLYIEHQERRENEEKHKMEMTFEKVKWKSVNKFAHTIEDKCSLSLSRLNEFLLNCNAMPCHGNV